jgi:hypothetical protein
MSVNPDNGPKENMYVCVPSPMVAYPSPPEICWHLMAPFTVDVPNAFGGGWGTRYPFGPMTNFVAPRYAGSELFKPLLSGSG